MPPAPVLRLSWLCRTCIFFFLLHCTLGFVPRLPPHLPADRRFISESINHGTKQIRTPSTGTALYGIPKLFRWLVDLYPLVLTQSVSEALPSSPRGDRSAGARYIMMNRLRFLQLLLLHIFSTCGHM